MCSGIRDAIELRCLASTFSHPDNRYSYHMSNTWYQWLVGRRQLRDRAVICVLLFSCNLIGQLCVGGPSQQLQYSYCKTKARSAGSGLKGGRNYSLWTRFQEHILQMKPHRTIPASYIFAYRICCSYFFISGNFSFSFVFRYGNVC